MSEAVAFSAGWLTSLWPALPWADLIATHRELTWRAYHNKCWPYAKTKDIRRKVKAVVKGIWARRDVDNVGGCKPTLALDRPEG